MSDENRDGDVAPLSAFPVELSLGTELRGWLEGVSDERIVGWVLPTDRGRIPLRLTFVEHGAAIAIIDSVGWRQDIAELNQGDGRCAFSVPTPATLRDGQVHHLDIREGGIDGPSIVAHPVIVRLNASIPASLQAMAAAVVGPLTRAKQDGPVLFSFIVNFYNMRREAERTLTALTTAYQRDAEDVSWEVLCIDNGSDPPLEEEWVKSFGPQFRLIRPTCKLPSPCFALNEAARMARGQYIAVMIDGAHVVTPGVVREAADAFAEKSNRIVGLRQWFFGGDQRWLSAVNYTREAEDIVFARIGWPHDGYRLFEVSTPMMPSPNTWFDGASESNCLFMPASLFANLGGYDEAFDTPGGSVSNLDLFARAAAAADDVVLLIGEASFHQFHGGTTTNVEDDEKDALVRSYMNKYKKMRGHELPYVEPHNIRYRGHMPNGQAKLMRQRPAFPSSLGITYRTRPGEAYQHFDSGAAAYAIGFAAESAMFDSCSWLGQPSGVGAGDLANLQEILHSVRPTRVVAVNQKPGMLAFIESVLELLKIDGARLVTVGPAHSRLSVLGNIRRHQVEGSTCAPSTLEEVRRALGAEPDVCVVFQPDDDDDLPIDSIRAYMRFVSLGSVMLVTRTAFGQPWLGYSKRWPRKAIQLLTPPDGEFRVDHSWERHLVTACPWGYLRRVHTHRSSSANYDLSLDDLTLI